MATLSAAIADAVVKCSTISNTRPGRGSNVRPASRHERNRRPQRRWFKRLPPTIRACACSSSTPMSAWLSSGHNGPRRKTASGERWKRCSGVLPVASSKRPKRLVPPARNHGHRYYGWSFENGVFRFFEHPVHFTREQAYEGKYVIQTEEPNLSPVEAVCVYKELSEIERAFASLKDVIEMRPIHHRTADRVQAHIFVASLALLIHRAIEKKLKAAGPDLSATEALFALKSLRVVDIALADGSSKRCVTQPTQSGAAILRALGISAI